MSDQEFEEFKSFIDDIISFYITESENIYTDVIAEEIATKYNIEVKQND